MLRINDTIFSLDILEKKFLCDLSVCKGSCCRYGDSGAPLSNSEVHILKEIWLLVRPYLRPEGIKAIEEQGTSIIDFQNELVTPLIRNEECAYTIMDDGIYKCGLEKAWSEGKISFRKPISCHLFPIRIKHFSSFQGVNYEELSICSCARQKGNSEGVYVYEFLKDPLFWALGEETYNELCIAARELRKRGAGRKHKS
jgi:hypothetical protein